MNHTALQDDLKRKVGLSILLSTGLIASIGTLIRHQQPDSDLSNEIVPFLFAIASFGASAYLWRNASSIRLISATILALSSLCIFIPSFLYTAHSFLSPSTALVDIYPPLTGGLLLWPTTILIFIPPQHRLVTISAGWLLGVVPPVSYLVLHPVEMQSSRGIDLLISLGPTLLIQIIMVLFYSRLQVLLDQLSAERLQYYSKVIETQTIRQEAMEQAFTQLHNGPLQSLAILLRDVETELGDSSPLFQRLAQLNTEFRGVGQGLTQDPLWNAAGKMGRRSPKSWQNQMPLVNAMLQLNPELCLDLNRPLHRLLHDVYSATLKRDFPYFQSIKVKIRNFQPLEDVALTVDVKRDICLWLEESLCNVGKHAQNVTRIQAIGEYQNGHYRLKVQDNGIGLIASSSKGSGDRGTKLSNRLAKQLGGTFHRESLAKGGVRCELSWPLNNLDEMNTI